MISAAEVKPRCSIMSKSHFQFCRSHLLLSSGATLLERTIDIGYIGAVVKLCCDRDVESCSEGHPFVIGPGGHIQLTTALRFRMLLSSVHAAQGDS
jgi:hypothetical protein